ncbi:hypothetical protein KQX54_002047 [Cotesia glomerata]|uniref:Uncharacterized protein n=1 Tax=Cotesia glomerata TaxID=32391 RepID=A0AAV7IBW5_COTGL|nr:hypothetical protein KQX54_002047 [Cotesia glomerata]
MRMSFAFEIPKINRETIRELLRRFNECVNVNSLFATLNSSKNKWAGEIRVDPTPGEKEVRLGNEDTKPDTVEGIERARKRG